MSRVRLAGVMVLTAMVLSACTVSNLSIRQDDRLSFLTPEDRAEVTLPFTVRWEVRDFEVGPGVGSFAVFVDRAPQPAGKALRWFARNDDACRTVPGCPDADYLAERDVYRTIDPRFTIEQLPGRIDTRREFHTITVVLLDGQNRRVAETGWSLDFEVERLR